MATPSRPSVTVKDAAASSSCVFPWRHHWLRKLNRPYADQPLVSLKLCRIPVTDANVDAAESLGKLREARGDCVRIANEGMQAVEIADAFRPEVILLDIAMPKLRDYKACRRIRLKKPKAMEQEPCSCSNDWLGPLIG